MADYSALFGDDPTEQEQAMALAQALRQQRGVGDVFAAHPLTRAQGQQMMADAQQQQQQLAAAPMQRLRLAMAKQDAMKQQAEMDTTAARQAALGDPNSFKSQTRTQLARRFGIQAPEGTPGAAIDDKELDLAER